MTAQVFISALSVLTAVLAIAYARKSARGAHATAREALLTSKSALKSAISAEHFKARAIAAENILFAMHDLIGAAEDLESHYWRPKYEQSFDDHPPITHAYRTKLLAEKRPLEQSLERAFIVGALVLPDSEQRQKDFQAAYDRIWQLVLDFTGDGPSLDPKINESLATMRRVYSETTSELTPIIRREEQATLLQ